MDCLIVDRDIASRLGQSTGRTEIRDPDGKVLGIYEPNDANRREAILEFAKKNFDLDRARQIVIDQGGDGITTPELLAHLHSLGGPS